MAQLVETLRAQLREREAELQGQKQVNHNLERDLQATQDKLHKTRELNVHLQTRVSPSSFPPPILSTYILTEFRFGFGWGVLVAYVNGDAVGAVRSRAWSCQ